MNIIYYISKIVMLSFENNINNEKPLCIIKDKSAKEVSKIYLFEKANGNIEGFEDLDIRDEFLFQQIPNQNNERDCIYVAGMSGSGKSYYIKDFVLQYIRKYPSREIILFSFKNEDKTLDAIKKIRRIDIYDAEFSNENLETPDFEDSLVIFDDIDCIPDKKLKNKLLNLLQQILQIGRSYKVTVCFACHEVCNGHETKPVLNECHSLTVFPRTMGNKKLKYLLENYFGMDKEQIEKLRTVDSRWVTIFKSYPRIVMGQQQIYVL
jgi:hypothetical protein